MCTATTGWADGFGRPAARGRMACPRRKRIVELARRFPGEISLVTIGPLTNAAFALRKDPEGFRLLKQIVIMGGAVWERGSVTATAEFNFFADTEAARESR